MQFVAKARFIRYSPYKLRPIIDVIRGKDAHYALQWLSTYASRRVSPIQKVLQSAVANARYKTATLDARTLLVKDIRIDQGPIIRYSKPGSHGRANLQRKRLSHISVVLEAKETKVKEKQA